MNQQKVAIVTDTTSCIPKDLAAELGIEVVPVVYIFGRESFRDGIDMTPSQFYERLKTAKSLPTTSGSLIVPYLDAYTRAAKRAAGVLCITISSKLSSMINSARLAQEMAAESLPDFPIEIIDSETAAGAQGLIVLAAARAAATGKSLTEVAEAAREVKSKVYLYAMLDTLSYLVKGGRAPRAAAIATSILRIKPILKIQAGAANSVENAITARNALQRLTNIVDEKRTKDQPLHLAVMHAEAETTARRFQEQLVIRFQPVESYLWEFTPVMGIHTGPGLIGVAFYSGEL